MKTLMKLAAVSVLASVVVGCTTQSTQPNVYSRDQLQQAQYTTYGTVLSIKPIQIAGESHTLINVASTAIGAIAASHIGGGTGRVVSGIVGGLGAGYATDAVSKQVSKTNGVEITVRLQDTQQVVTFAQEGTIDTLFVGQKVKLTKDYQGRWKYDSH